ncbi:hypothetical protein QR680_016002 [Steinernema hermaphroditum]|uniref:Uncharacterized protein n=1 Tax=Steinernema hermaphroditum TaxID=289476 RepID=A0AA39LLU7_9BILA|nr:hypothetical protein QR680_016002 [Steinernema hermaphroditum]
MESAVLPYCSSNDTDIHPVEPNHLAFKSQRSLFGLIYLLGFIIGAVPQSLCLYSICHPHHLKYPCYKLMLFVSVLDLCNLTTSFLISGIYSIAGIQHCKHGYVVIVVGYATLWLWFAYSASAMVLALNRLLEFTSKTLSDLFFGGYRSYLWLIVIVSYASAIQFTVPRPFYFYNPDEGAWNFFTLNPNHTNINHVFNNIFKFLFVTISYGVMWCLLKHKMKVGSALGGQISTLEAKLSIQALIVGILAAFSTIGYLAMSYLPVKDVPMMGFLGEWLWASVHGGSAYIYLIMNRSIRSTAFQCLKPQYKISNTTTTRIQTISAQSNMFMRNSRIP